MRLKTGAYDMQYIRTQIITFNFGPNYEPDRNLESSWYTCMVKNGSNLDG